MMKQKLLNYSLEIFCAAVIVLTLIRILFFPELPLIRSLVAGYALLAVLHEFEEKRTPGGFFEMIGHTMLPVVGKLGKPYSPGMVSAWLMGAMSIYSILCINKAGLATGSDYLIGTLLMVVGFALMQRATLISSGMRYSDLLKNIKSLLFSKNQTN